MKRKLLLLSLCLSGLLPAKAQIDYSKGLVAYYPFNGNANDESGFGNNGYAYGGATLTTDQWGRANSAYHFNGKSSYIIVPTAGILSPTKKFSVCAKVHMEGFYDGFCYNNVILAKGFDRTDGSYSLRTTTIGYDCSIQDTTKHVYRCDVQTIGAYDPIDFDTKPYIKLNNWDCLIGTYENDTVKMYVNGDLRYQYYEPAKTTNSDDLYIGKLGPYDGAFWFNGIIDEVRLYNRALTAEEISGYCSADSIITTSAIASATPSVTFEVYPNPVQDKMQLRYTIQSNDLMTLSIQDIAGRTLLQQQPAASQGSNTHTIDVSGLNKGIYFIRIQSDKINITQRFFKD